MPLSENCLIFDFDQWVLGEFVIGESLSKNIEKINLFNKKKGYQVYVKNNQIIGVFICLRSGYREYNKFQGKFYKNQHDLDLFSSWQPEDILNIFGKPYRQWDDGSEISMEFKEDKYQFEFVWKIRIGNPQLNYMIVELSP